MKRSAYVISIGLPLLITMADCAKEGLVNIGTGGTAGGGRPGLGGVIGMDGGLSGTGGTIGAGGRVGTDGGLGVGGMLGAGGLGGTGGRLGGGGVVGVGGRVGTGGLLATGGVSAGGGVVGTGGSTNVGTGGRAGMDGGMDAPSGGVTTAGGTKGAGGVVGSGGAVGTGGSTSNVCGTIAGLVCPSGQFCDMPVGTCGNASDLGGTCVATGGIICPEIYAPVCGCDGVTYSNDCARQAKGVSKLAEGACPPASTPCPTDISQISAWPCTEGLTCEYGTDPRPSCRASATCSNGTWVVSQVKCTQLPPVTCPDTRDAAAGQLCPTDGAYCVYGDLSCECTNCTNGPVTGCGGDFTWHCAAPNPDATCPAGIPLLGSACTTADQTCTYACGAGGARLCKNGAWYTADGGPCPVSVRRAKKHILYVTAAERQRIAHELASFKLATYEYRDPALAGHRHLGFIIDDVPGSPAVDRDGHMVDLYGYASMLVAAVQAQGEEIAHLKAELARLKARTRDR